MTDCFALLNEPRRPWVETDALKAKFLTLSSQFHPDKVQTTDPTQKDAVTRHYAELNAAYNCLREPKVRLQHLLELELGAKPKDLQQIPADLAEVFVEIAKLCRETDDYLMKKAKTSSPLLHAQMFERGQVWTEQLLSRQQDLGQRQHALLTQLQMADKAWPETEANPTMRVKLLERLQEMWRLLSFLTRWSSQVQERITRLLA